MKLKRKLSIGLLSVFATLTVLTLTSMEMNENENETNAYLEITLDISAENREKAAGVYLKYKEPFLKKIEGATSKQLLLRTDDVQVLHGFKSEAEANAYLSTKLFQDDVVKELKPYLESDPEVRVYSVFKN